MNRVTCVSGLRQEGKTTELVNEFKDLSESCIAIKKSLLRHISLPARLLISTTASG